MNEEKGYYRETTERGITRIRSMHRKHREPGGYQRYLHWFDNLIEENTRNKVIIANQQELLDLYRCKMLSFESKNLDNLNMDTTAMPEGEQTDMAKQIKERVQIGLNENGKPDYRWATGYSRQEVLLSAAQILQEHGKLDDPAEPPAHKEHLFADYAQSFYELYKAANLRHTTLSAQRSLLNKHLIPAFGHLDITEITTDAIQEMLNSKREYSKKTLHEIVMVLGMILDSAVEDGIIQRNPAKSKRLKNPSSKKKERLALTEEQVQNIIEHIPTLTQSRDRRFLALLLYTGMRREEVLGLRWSDIEANSVTPKLHVRQTITFKGNAPIVGDTKTSSGVRDIPIHPDLLQWLTVEDENQEYVIQDHMTQQIVKRMWMRISKEINVYGATPHCFRHSFTTMCRRSGMDEKVMQKIGGWSDIATMRNVYTHVQAKDIDTAAQIMNGMFRTPEKPAM